MYIHFDSKTMFLATPRTGSTAVREALSSNGFLRGKDSYDILRNPPSYRGHHRTLDNSLPDGWLVFSFVRNPFDHLVSWYYAAKRLQHYTKEFGPHFIYDLFHSFWAAGRGLVEGRSMLSLHRHSTDVFLKYEGLEENLNGLLRERGIEEVKLERVNVSEERKTKEYREYYDPEFRSIMEDYFAKDFVSFDYSW